jgi:hypothetical protein
MSNLKLLIMGAENLKTQLQDTNLRTVSKTKNKLNINTISPEFNFKNRKGDIEKPKTKVLF